jgi:hypothetical protein
MSKQSEFDQKLEQLLNDALAGMPQRRAPGTLESRIFNELERRAALPWWRRSFSYWPMPARATFLLLCAALIGLTLLGGISAVVGPHSLADIGAPALLWMRPLLALMSSAGVLLALLLRVIPAVWIYVGLGVGTVLYVALFGLGAAAYRTLYVRPSLAGNRS